jgi:hypothetical protein
MSSSFTNQVLAQIELWTGGTVRERRLRLPKHLDEKVAALHLDKLGVKLTQLSQRQADYIGVPVEGRSSRSIIATDPGAMLPKGRRGTGRGGPFFRRRIIASARVMAHSERDHFP